MYRAGSFFIAALVVLVASGDVHAKDRTSAWREDLTVARDVFLQKDRSYTAETRRAAYDEIERTRMRVDHLTDQQIVASLARAAALSDNAHTRAYLLRNRSYWRRFPLRIWRFPDGWYVVAARAQGTPLVGGRITHIQHVPVEQAFEKVRTLYAGNAGWANYMSTYTLPSLPNSGIAMHFADGLHQYSDAPPPAGVKEFLQLNIDVRNLEPDIAVDWTGRDYISGADPATATAANGTLRCSG